LVHFSRISIIRIHKDPIGFEIENSYVRKRSLVFRPLLKINSKRLGSFYVPLLREVSRQHFGRTESVEKFIEFQIESLRELSERSEEVLSELEKKVSPGFKKIFFDPTKKILPRVFREELEELEKNPDLSWADLVWFFLDIQKRKSNSARVVLISRDKIKEVLSNVEKIRELSKVYSETVAEKMAFLEKTAEKMKSKRRLLV